MGTRQELHTILENIIGSKNVYYQLPSVLHYPCITYERSDIFHNNADNKKYFKKTRYTVTFITKDYNHEEILNKLMDLEYCNLNRQFINDNLYHLVFDLYY